MQTSNVSSDCVWFEHEDFNDSMSMIEELRRQRSPCDVILKVGDVSIYAHKLVLTASIPYFYTMFTGDLMESRQPEVEIQAIDAKTLQQFVNYAYTHKILLTCENIENIINGSEYLQLNNVKEACVEFLCSRLDPQNVIALKSLGDSLSCPVLFESADQYISRHFKEVASSDEFLNISHADLASIIRRDDLHVDNEEIIFEAVMKWARHNNSSSSVIEDDLLDLLKLVRFPLIASAYLVDHVMNSALFKTSLEYHKMILEVMTYRLLPERQRTLNTFLTVPRGCKIYFVGEPNDTHRVKCLNLATKKYTAGPSMITKRLYLAMVVLHEKLYAIGGVKSLLDEGGLSSVEVLDLSKNCWEEVSSLNTGRRSFGAVVLGNKIYVCGGCDKLRLFNTVERYCPKENKWTYVCPMNISRKNLATVHLNGFIYALGGRSGRRSTPLNSVDRYDPATNQWTAMKPMISQRSGLKAAVLNGKIYACGGWRDAMIKWFCDELFSVEVYDPQTDTWSLVASMTMHRWTVAVATNAEKLLAIRGRNGSNNLDLVESYNPLVNKWQLEMTIKKDSSREIRLGVSCCADYITALLVGASEHLPL